MSGSGSRTVKTTKNVVVSIALSIVSLVLNYVARVIFVQYLDASYLGINGLFSNVISLFSLADLGIATAMMFSFYKPLKEHDEIKTTQLVRFFRKVYLIIAAAILIIGLAFIPLLPYIVNLPSNIDYLTWYYVLFVIEASSSYLFVYKTTLLSADQKSYLLNIVGLAFEIAKFGLRILFLILFRNYFIYIAVGIGTNLIGNFCKSIATNHFYPFLRNKPKEPLSNADKKEIGRNVRSTFIYRVCGILQNNTDNILISILVGTISVGLYSNYLAMVNSVVSFINVIYASVKASVGNYMLEAPTPEAKLSLFNTFEQINIFIAGVCAFCFFACFNKFILFSYGIEYLLDFPTLFAIVLAFVTSNVKQNTWVFRETAGIFDQVKWLPVVSTIINLALSVLLGYFLGIFGILISTSISRIVFAYWREPMILYRDVFLTSSRNYLIEMFIRLAIIMIGGTGLYFLASLINTTILIADLLLDLILALSIGFIFFGLLNFQGLKYIWQHLTIIVKKKRGKIAN